MTWHELMGALDGEWGDWAALLPAALYLWFLVLERWGGQGRGRR